MHQARRKLLHFTKYTFPAYKAEPFHELVAATLDGVVAGEIHRLMLFAPPQHGKTELVSIRLPAFFLGKRPDEPVILTSYAASLALRNSRHTRRTLNSAQYKRLFPDVCINPRSRSVEHWEIDGKRGGLVAAGVGGPITGFGAKLAIIDDPFKNFEQAQSETYREMVWEWWRTTFRPRVWEDGAIVLIMTRWHKDDLAGRLLKQQADQWTILRLPAIAETQKERDTNDKLLGLPIGQSDPLGRDPEEPLSPERYGLGTLLELQRDIGSYAWAAEYQGSPQPMEGNLAKRHWFEIVDQAPRAVKARVRAWDFAATEKKAGKADPDYTVGTRMSVLQGIYYVEDVIRERVGPGAVERLARQTADIDGKKVRIRLEQEPGASGKLFVATMIKVLDGWNVGAEPSTGDKIIRAMPFLAQAEAGNVRLVRGAWNEEWLGEMCSVPHAPHDDQWDSAAAAYEELQEEKPRGGVKRYA